MPVIIFDRVVGVYVSFRAPAIELIISWDVIAFESADAPTQLTSQLII